MCKRCVLVNFFKLPGLFTTLLVITLLLTAIKPGVCDPRFIYSDDKVDRNRLAGELNRASAEQKGLQAIFIEGRLRTEILQNSLPDSHALTISGGVIANLSDKQIVDLEANQPTFRHAAIDQTLSQVKTSLSNEQNEIPIQWNQKIAGVDILKKFYSLKGKNRTIGVISLDYPYGHQSLQGRIKQHKLFGEPLTESQKDSRGIKDLHLVHPLGLVAGYDPTMFEGIAPECDVILAQVSQKTSKAITLLEAIEWMLVQEPAPDAILFCTDFKAPAPLPVKRALNACRNAGIIPIVPAGNNPNTITGMAALPSCVTVGAIDRWKQRALFSGTGPVVFEGQQIMKPDCVEPGSAVLGPTDHIEYKFGSGTLQAAAHFAGVFLLVKEALPPETDPELIVNALLSKCEDIGEAGPDYETGNGLPSPVGAINHILYPPEED
ncbi:MAG: serine protease AprX [Clostridiales bacterium]|nr:serine protease AprX [Clostridiales bacterium]MDN5282727.1 serine protease AprX [Candidatus Ozemobacter sp.]